VARIRLLSTIFLKNDIVIVNVVGNTKYCISPEFEKRRLLISMESLPELYSVKLKR
jgi:hypothetical protein